MIQNEGRRRGRPRSFDEDEALERAVQVFWAKGYDGATIDDLVAGMGVGRPSLYATFGDKQALFMRCLQRYAEHKGAAAVKALLGARDVRGAVRGFLLHSVESATEEGSAWGCLIVCVAPLVDDDRVRDFLRRASEDTVAVVERRLREAVEARELPSEFPARVRAKQILDLARGLSVRARTAPSRDELLADAEAAAELVLLSGAPGGRSPRKGVTRRRASKRTDA
jgi:AcrR family transcriptional regulator